MAWTVWKYELVEGTVEHRIPRGAWVLSVGVQNHRVVLWVCVNPAQKNMKVHRFHVVQTGAVMPDQDGDPPAYFHGTVLLDGGAHVLHVFEEVGHE